MVRRSALLACMVAASLFSASVLVSSDVHAQPNDEVDAARTKFRDGLDLESAGDWAGALAQFESVARVRMTPAVRFHIARCQHHLGKLLEALGGYRLAAHEAENDANAVEILREANDGIRAIEPLIPTLIIKRGEGAEASAVVLDGVTLGDTTLQKPVKVNPGVHTLQFTAADGTTVTRVVQVEQRQTKHVILATSSAENKVQRPTASTQGPIDTSPSSATTESSSNPWPWLAYGLGGASLITSGVFYGLRADTINKHDKECVNGVCPESLRSTGNNGKTYTTVANVTLGVGIAGVVVGTILLFTTGKSSSSAPEDNQRSASKNPIRLIVTGGSHDAQASVRGTF